MSTQDPSRTGAERDRSQGAQGGQAGLALICDDQPGRLPAIRAALLDLGYVPSVAPGPREALHWLRHHSFRLALLHQHFAGATEENHPVLAAIYNMPMKVRRNLCVGLCGPDLRTLDNLSAFYLSVNFVCGDMDLPQIQTVIQRAVADNDAFYLPFRDILLQAGRGFGRRAYDRP